MFGSGTSPLLNPMMLNPMYPMSTNLFPTNGFAAPHPFKGGQPGLQGTSFGGFGVPPPQMPGVPGQPLLTVPGVVISPTPSPILAHFHLLILVILLYHHQQQQQQQQLLLPLEHPQQILDHQVKHHYKL